MVDQNATSSTQALYKMLIELGPTKTLFGHQDTLAYGVNWKGYHPWRSDIYDVGGKFPAVFGWDLGKLGSAPRNLDKVDFTHMQTWMKEVHRRGGINTVSWHFDNFVRGTDSWDVRGKVVAAILPGGAAHRAYLDKLDSFAEFTRGLKIEDSDTELVPLLFRPFHEHTGDWFWWGNKHCTVDEYRALWRFTVHYLRDQKQMHNLIWVYSPDRFRNKAHYLERYPGDDYVDVLGLDNYHDLGPWGSTKAFTSQLRSIVELAEERGKVAALTETGLEAVPHQRWWTEVLLSSIQSDPVAARIAWVLLWRNDRADHHYGPYPGHPSVDNFLAFSSNPAVWFLDDLAITDFTS